MDNSKKENAYQIIKERIISGDIPPMASISEETLAKELGVSRMPIHQAILKLDSEGFVYIYPRRGTVVADISLDTIRWVYEMRKVIEPYMVRKACEALPKEQVISMRSEFEEIRLRLESGDTDIIGEATRCDLHLHSTIINCTGNRIMNNMVSSLSDYDQWIRIRSSHANSNYLESVKAHLRILDAIIDCNPDLAEKEMREHILFSEKEAVHYA